MPLVTAKYGDNVKATVRVKNVGGAPGRFRLQGTFGGPHGSGKFWDRKVVGDPLQAPTLVQQAGAKDYVDTPQPLNPGQEAVLEMWTAPLWKPGDVATVLNTVTWTLTCIETGQAVTMTQADAIAVTGQPQGSIVNVTYAVG